MAEPTSSSGGAGLAVALVAMLGPVAGEYAAILFAALAGALWPLSATATITRRAGAWMLLRLVATSVALTGVAAWAANQHLGIPVSTALAPVSFAIAAMGDRWRDMIALAVARLRRAAGGRGK